jgi:molybdate/tungstate transport system substrate-binding protein
MGKSRLYAGVAGLSLLAALSAGCSSSSSPSSSGSAQGSGPVDVLYAGSLVDMMQNQVGPAFQKADGYSVNGISGGSKDLATQIKGKVHPGDVFISASPKVNKKLEGAANGDWVKWYATFASSKLVIGYNPKSKFASQLKSKPWYDVVTQPGFRLGFTDPATDPKGELAAEALTDTASKQKLPALKKLAANTADVFPEETLVGRLQSGQLDAGFFYTAEATAGKIATVPVTGEDLKATYTISVLNQAPHEAAAEKFVSYLLGSAGQATLKKDGFDLTSPPKVSGSGVPSSLSSVLKK